MKVMDLTKRMNDYGTRPRINVLKHETDRAILIYEGAPGKISDEIGQLKVNSFTVRGVGFIEIHTQ